MSHFQLPEIIDHSGWGPVPAATILASLPQQPSVEESSVASPAPASDSSSQPQAAAYQPVPAGAFMFSELPFQPFNKMDKLWRVSDWTQKEERWNRSNWGVGASGGILGDEGLPLDDEAEGGSFSLVDNRPKLKPKYGKTTFKRGMMQGGGGAGAGARRGPGGNRPGQTGAGGNRGPQGGRMQNQRPGQRGPARPGQRGGPGGRSGPHRAMGYGDRSAAELREPSVVLDPSWPKALEVDISNLANFVAEVEDGEDISFAGSLEVVQPRFSKVNPRNPLPLVRFDNRQHFTASTSEDPVLQKLMADKVGNVYATDSILSVLMAAPRSVNSWDILVHKEGDNIYLDKRPLSRIDYVSVNENWNESTSQDKDSVNHPDNLALEATFINHNFSQQLLSVPANQEKQPSHEFEQPNPFLPSLQKGQEPASTAFRYRKWQLPGGINLVARTSLNGFVERKDGETQFVMAKALNEFDSKLQGNVDWRQKLEQQTGAVLASEMKNNQYKLSRWVGEAVMSGAGDFRLGFVSRVNPKNAHKHAILMVKSFTPNTFADSVNVPVNRLWGSLAQIIVNIKKLEDGHYVMMRDPQKPLLHFYQVPKDAFEHEAEELEEGDDE